jgi:hypothetical protein
MSHRVHLQRTAHVARTGGQQAARAIRSHPQQPRGAAAEGSPPKAGLRPQPPKRAPVGEGAERSPAIGTYT